MQLVNVVLCLYLVSIGLQYGDSRRNKTLKAKIKKLMQENTRLNREIYELDIRADLMDARMDQLEGEAMDE